MRGNDAQGLVLDAFPQLVFLKIIFLHDEAVDEYVLEDWDYRGIIRNISLDLPSLEKLLLRKAYSVSNCTLVCPKLVDIEFAECERMTTLNFNGGARLNRLISKS